MSTKIPLKFFEIEDYWMVNVSGSLTIDIVVDDPQSNPSFMEEYIDYANCEIDTDLEITEM